MNNKKNMDNSKLVEQNFMGFNNSNGTHNECVFCGKYFTKDMILEGACPHCWAFCFSNQLDLEKFTYKGSKSNDNVKNFLKITWLGHPISCNNNDCVYYKIYKLFKENKLNNEIAKLLGLIEVIKEEKIKSYNLQNKNRDVSINYKLSSITI